MNNKEGRGRDNNCVEDSMASASRRPRRRSFPWHFAGFDCSVVGQQAAARVGDDPAELLSFNLLLIYKPPPCSRKSL